MFKTLGGFVMLVSFTNIKSYGISGQIFDLISCFVSNGQLQVVLDGKSSLEYSIIATVFYGSILAPTLFLPAS